MKRPRRNHSATFKAKTLRIKIGEDPPPRHSTIKTRRKLSSVDSFTVVTWYSLRC